MIPIPPDTLARLRAIQKRRTHAEELWETTVQTILDLAGEESNDCTVDLDNGLIKPSPNDDSD